ncbi:MAG TPA: tripartite tricarboxylate transporter substrate binding protein [Burkholderiales bacterium]|nr:tripartite tricarboxylate transporter substrate binding protein [Burkholderiales bacterium]
MNHSRSALLFICLVTIGGASPAAAASTADTFPSKPIRFVVGFPPGGGNDLLARMVGQKLADRTGRAVVIDNRPGAGGNLAADLVAKAPPDGYTILMISSSHPIQGLLKKSLPYDPIRDFAGVAQLVVYRSILVVHPSVAAHSVRELIALAQSRPAQLMFVSSGNGAGSHLAGELFRIATKVDITHVPYKGTAQAVTDLLSGRVQMMFTPLLPVLQQLQAGRLRALAVTSRNRSRIMPELPTVEEAGVQGYEFVGWYGILAPAATPKAALRKLNAEVAQIVQSPDIKERIYAEDMDLVNAPPDQFDVVRKNELAKWSRIVKQTGIHVE